MRNIMIITALLISVAVQGQIKKGTVETVVNYKPKQDNFREFHPEYMRALFYLNGTKMEIAIKGLYSEEERFILELVGFEAAPYVTYKLNSKEFGFMQLSIDDDNNFCFSGLKFKRPNGEVRYGIQYVGVIE